jgi:hypothetical protein
LAYVLQQHLTEDGCPAFLLKVLPAPKAWESDLPVLLQLVLLRVLLP